MARVVVVGGGLSGLVAAHRAAAVGHDVTCLEPAQRPGGYIGSERRDGFLVETGPQALMVGNPSSLELLGSLGLTEALVYAGPEARRRMIFVGGRLRAAPSGPLGVLTSSILSPAGKLRLLREPWIPAPTEPADESILDFASRRIGPEAAARLVGAAVIGIYGGDAATLSVRSTFKRLPELEARHGSLVRGAFRERKVHPRRRIASFRDGLEVLPQALATALGPRLLQARARQIVARAGGFTVACDPDRSIDAERVIVATPAAVSATLLADLAPRAAAILRAIVHAPAAVVALGWRQANRRSLGMDLGAYGFLVGRGEGVRILGCQYESTIFPGRAPEGGVLLRVIVGGAFEPAMVDLDDRTLTDQVLADLHRVGGLRRDAAPELVSITRHAHAIPQPRVGHGAAVAELDDALRAWPGLRVIGQALRGVGLADCLDTGMAVGAEP